MAKNILRKLAQISSLLIRLRRTLKEDITNISILREFDADLKNILILIQQICAFAFYKGSPISDLSSLVHHDICVLLQVLLIFKLVQARIDDIWAGCRITGQELSPRQDCLTNISEDIKIISRDGFGPFSILDFFSNGQELRQVK